MSGQLQGQKEYHFAVVTRNEDDKLKAKARGAVYFKSDTLTNGTEYPEPAQPSFPLAGGKNEGFFWVPQVGDQIEVEIDKGSEHPVPKYTRMIYSSVDEIHAEFVKNYPFRMGWITRVGHIFLFDNKEDALLVWLKHKIGTEFQWNKDGDELKTIIRDLKETIKRDVIREIGGKLTEKIVAEVTREVGGKLTEKFKASVMREIAAGLREKVGADKDLQVTGKSTTKTGGAHETTAGGTLKETAPSIEMNGSAGMVLTTATDPVVDLITGVPTIGVPTVKAG